MRWFFVPWLMALRICTAPRADALVISRNQRTHLAYSRCVGPAAANTPNTPIPAAVTWEREFHHLAPAGLRMVICTRCGLHTAQARASQWRQRMCVARRLHVGGRATATDWGALLARQLGWAPGPPRATATILQHLGVGPARPAGDRLAALTSPVLSVRAMGFGHGVRARRAAVQPTSPASALLRIFAPQRAPPTSAQDQAAQTAGPGSGRSVAAGRARDSVRTRLRPVVGVTLGPGRVHLLLATALCTLCLMCGRAFTGAHSQATAVQCSGWAPFLTSLAARALRSSEALGLLRELPEDHPSLAAALRRGIGLALDEAAPLRPREPD